MTLHIVMYDNMFMSLQESALEAGHTVHAYVENAPKLPAADFRAVASRKGKLNQLMSVEALLAEAKKQRGPEDQTLVVLSHWEHEVADRVRAHCENLPRTVIIGSSNRAKLLETDRQYARDVVRGIAQPRYFSVVKQRVFEDRQECLAYLKNKEQFVVKEHPSTEGQGVAAMTAIAKDKESRAHILQMLSQEENMWWPEQTDEVNYSGCVVEDYVVGQEIAFSCFFDGNSFRFPLLANVEQKDAQEDNRSGILTGEVGSTIEPIMPDRKSPIADFFLELETYLQGHVGMVDANFLYSKGKLHFIEFTVRFGRPTLETQVAMVEERDLALQLYEAAQNGRAFKYHPGIGVAHTLYHYGYPLLQKFDDEVVRQNVTAPRFQLPKEKRGKDTLARAVPFFSLYKKGAWEGSVTDGRYAVVLGVGPNMGSAKEAAAAMLRDIKIPQVIYRRDIGHTHEATIRALREAKILF